MTSGTPEPTHRPQHAGADTTVSPTGLEDAVCERFTRLRTVMMQCVEMFEARGDLLAVDALYVAYFNWSTRVNDVPAETEAQHRMITALTTERHRYEALLRSR